MKNKISNYLFRILYFNTKPGMVRLGMDRRDWRNITKGRFIRITDPFKNRRYPYHLVQGIPRKILLDKRNPYRHLVD